MIYKAQL